jgi:hypothetical protein
VEAAVPHLIALCVCGYVALHMWLAGGAPRLSGIDYRQVSDPIALNRWAARWLSVLPVVAGVNAFLAATGSLPDVVLWSLFLCAVVVVVTIIARGARRF